MARAVLRTVDAVLRGITQRVAAGVVGAVLWTGRRSLAALTPLADAVATRPAAVQRAGERPLSGIAEAVAAHGAVARAGLVQVVPVFVAAIRLTQAVAADAGLLALVFVLAVGQAVAVVVHLVVAHLLCGRGRVAGRQAALCADARARARAPRVRLRAGRGERGGDGRRRARAGAGYWYALAYGVPFDGQRVTTDVAARAVAALAARSAAEAAHALVVAHAHVGRSSQEPTVGVGVARQAQAGRLRDADVDRVRGVDLAAGPARRAADLARHAADAISEVPQAEARQAVPALLAWAPEGAGHRLARWRRVDAPILRVGLLHLHVDALVLGLVHGAVWFERRQIVHAVEPVGRRVEPPVEPDHVGRSVPRSARPARTAGRERDRRGDDEDRERGP